ncbi:MAG: HPF/RaiA family ribosome-associated protein [Planctomycetaceae bacterium]
MYRHASGKAPGFDESDVNGVGPLRLYCKEIHLGKHRAGCDQFSMAMSRTPKYITRKSEKLLTYFERVTAIEVTLGFEKASRLSAEILVDAEHKHNFVASGREAPMRWRRLTAHAQDGATDQKVQGRSCRICRRDRPLNEIAGDPTAVEDNSEED